MGYSLEYRVALSSQPFVCLDFTINLRRRVERLLENADAADKDAVDAICREFAEDLLANQNPTPSIARGFFAADMMRAKGVTPLSSRRRKLTPWRVLKTGLIMAGVAREFKRYYLEGHFARYEFRKYFSGYVALIENDYKSILAALASISGVVQSEGCSFKDARRTFSSQDLKAKEVLVKLVVLARCGLVLRPYDRHLRNALVHGTYSVDGEVIKYQDRAFSGEIIFLAFLSKFMHLKAVNELVSTMLVRDGQLQAKIARHWDPEWWPDEDQE